MQKIIISGIFLVFFIVVSGVRAQTGVLELIEVQTIQNSINTQQIETGKKLLEKAEETGDKVEQHNETNLEFLRESADKDTEGDPDRPLVVGEVSNSTIENEVRIEAVQVRGWDTTKKKEFLGTVKAHSELKSEKDLENFALGVMVKDENVESVTLNFAEIKMEYKMPAKFLGFINAELTAQIDVDEEGRVKIKYPWIRIFYSESVGANDLQGAIESETINIKAGDAVRRQAETLQTISNISKMFHDTAMSIIRKIG